MSFPEARVLLHTWDQSDPASHRPVRSLFLLSNHIQPRLRGCDGLKGEFHCKCLLCFEFYPKNSWETIPAWPGLLPAPVVTMQVGGLACAATARAGNRIWGSQHLLLRPFNLIVKLHFYGLAREK